MATWAERAFALSQRSADVNRRLLTGVMLTLYHLWMGDPAKAAIVIESLREVARSRDSSPLAQLSLRVVEAHYHWHMAEHGARLQAVAEGLELARSTGVHIWESQMCAEGAYTCLSTGDLAGAGEFLQQMAAGLEGGRSLNLSLYHYLAAWGAALRRDVPVASRHAEEALRVAAETGTPIPEALSHLAMAQVLHEREEHRMADDHLKRALSIGRQVGSRMIQFTGLLAEAWFSLDLGDEEKGLRALGRALALGRERGYVTALWWRPSVMARLCVQALEAGVEVDYVRRLVRLHGLVPDSPPFHVENWPWPVRIGTLGGFELTIDGKPARFSGKVQQRPLALVKVLIAFGARNVPEARLADALWPEAEGDAAHQAFATTLHRLRQLLGHDRAVTLQGGW